MMELSLSQGRSQGTPPGLTCTCRGLRCVAILYCYPSTQAGSWAESGAAGTQIATQEESRIQAPGGAGLAIPGVAWDPEETSSQG